MDETGFIGFGLSSKTGLKLSPRSKMWRKDLWVVH